MLLVLYFACGFIITQIVCGCSAVLPGQAVNLYGQDEAMRIVWNGAYGRGDAPPTVRWVFAAGQTCTDPATGRGGFPTTVGCKEGVCLLPSEVSVAIHDGEPFSTTAFAHEAMHAAQWRGGTFDPYHRTPAFQPGGAVEIANALLAVEGW